MSRITRIIRGFGPLYALMMLGLTGCKKEAGTESVPSYGTRATVQLIHTSPVPDPKQSTYADCLYTAEAKVLEIRGGPRVSREIILALPAFLKRALQPEASFNDGEVIEVDLIPHQRAGDRLKTMQRSDAMDRFDLPVFDGINARHSSKALNTFAVQPDSYFENNQNAAHPETPAQPAPPVRYPWSAKAGEERQAAITHDKETILKALKDNGGTWEGWEDKLQPFRDNLFDQVDVAPNRELIKGTCIFHELVRGSYRKLCNKGDALEPGPLMMLSSLNAQLRARGIDLIVVPFPTKEDVHAELFSKLAPADGWFEPYRQKFLLQLLEANIEVIDLTQPLRAARSRFPYVFYDDDDQHPADGAIQVTAEEIARRLARYELVGKDTKPLHLHLNPTEVEKPRDHGVRKYPATQVLGEDGKLLVVPENSGSPVIIMGDSYIRIPHQYLEGGDGCAIPMHLAYHLGIVPDNLTRMGGSNQAMRLLAREGGDYLAHRRALVFVFAYTRLFGSVVKNLAHDGDAWDMVSLPPLRLNR